MNISLATIEDDLLIDLKISINKDKYPDIYIEIEKEYNKRVSGNNTNVNKLKFFSEWNIKSISYFSIFLCIILLLLKIILLYFDINSLNFYLFLCWVIFSFGIFLYYYFVEFDNFFKYLKFNHPVKWNDLAGYCQCNNYRFELFAFNDDILDDVCVLIFKINLKKCHTFLIIFSVSMIIVYFLFMF